MIKICNLKIVKPTEYYDFIVDRRTPLGNLFIMKQEWERDAVCDEYDNYFPILLDRSDAYDYFIIIYKTYKKYGLLRFFCWCAPKRCHAETIKKYILEYSNRRNMSYSY